MRGKFCSIAFLIGLVVSDAAYAQGTQDQKTVYQPSDFVRYGPLNARDMVERIPGFRLNSTNEDVRGFGQATENVLINGQRLSSKSSSAADQLERIPAENVKRIELLDGASLDIPGLSGLVVNIIARSSGLTGTWTYSPSFRPGLSPFWDNAEVLVSGQNGNLGWSLNAKSNPRGSKSYGTETFVSADGTLLESRQLDRRFLIPERGVNGALRWTPASGVILNLNAEYDVSERDFLEFADITPAFGPQTQQEFDQLSKVKAGEIGADVEFGLGLGRLKLISVYSNRESPLNSLRRERNLSGSLFDENLFLQNTDETETIGRAEYKFPALNGNWEASWETAFNTLKSESMLFSGDGSSAPLEVDIGDTAVRVEELRHEGFITYSRALRDDIQMQLSFGGEISEITSEGVNSQTRRFTRPKGGLTLSWDADDNTRMNARLNRQVGQLDFFDFVSELDLDNGEDQAGNADIVPEQNWRGEIEVEQGFGDWGAGSALIFIEALEDIIDQVPIGAGEGPGNIDDASRFGLELDGTLKFDPLGLDGAQLGLSALFQKSNLEDPLTGISRAINEDDIFELEFDFRHDIKGTDLAWGFLFSPERAADNFRLNSIRRERESPGRLSLFVEHKNVFGLTVKARLLRPFEEKETETRRIFSPNRDGSLTQIQTSRITGKRILVFDISGRF